MSMKNTYYIYLNDKGNTLNPKQKKQNIYIYTKTSSKLQGQLRSNHHLINRNNEWEK